MLIVAGLSPQRPVFTPGSFHVGFVVDTVALKQSSLSSSVFSFNIIPPWLSILTCHPGDEQEARCGRSSET
jgi:hypothetical protein